jgi:hypothetical protein
MASNLKLILLLIVISFIGCSKDDDSSISTNYITPNNFLSSQKYDRLIIEINYVNGYEPTDASMQNLVAFLTNRLNKPKGITVVKKGIPSPVKSPFTIQDIKLLERIYRKLNPTLNTLTVHILFLDAGYNLDNSKILGIAYGSTSIAIFEKTIMDYSGGLTQPNQNDLETTVINHEFGHLLGLVNNGSPDLSGHQDTANGHHCNNTGCLMYYTAQTSDIAANLIGGNIPDLDSQCINDLQSNGGK